MAMALPLPSYKRFYRFTLTTRELQVRKGKEEVVLIVELYEMEKDEIVIDVRWVKYFYERSVKYTVENHKFHLTMSTRYSRINIQRKHVVKLQLPDGSSANLKVNVFALENKETTVEGFRDSKFSVFHVHMERYNHNGNEVTRRWFPTKKKNQFISQEYLYGFNLCEIKLSQEDKGKWLPNYTHWSWTNPRELFDDKFETKSIEDLDIDLEECGMEEDMTTRRGSSSTSARKSPEVPTLSFMMHDQPMRPAAPLNATLSVNEFNPDISEIWMIPDLVSEKEDAFSDASENVVEMEGNFMNSTDDYVSSSVPPSTQNIIEDTNATGITLGTGDVQVHSISSNIESLEPPSSSFKPLVSESSNDVNVSSTGMSPELYSNQTHPSSIFGRDMQRLLPLTKTANETSSNGIVDANINGRENASNQSKKVLPPIGAERKSKTASANHHRNGSSTTGFSRNQSNISLIQKKFIDDFFKNYYPKPPKRRSVNNYLVHPRGSSLPKPTNLVTTGQQSRKMFLSVQANGLTQGRQQLISTSLNTREQLAQYYRGHDIVRNASYQSQPNFQPQSNYQHFTQMLKMNARQPQATRHQLSPMHLNISITPATPIARFTPATPIAPFAPATPNVPFSPATPIAPFTTANPYAPIITANRYATFIPTTPIGPFNIATPKAQFTPANIITPFTTANPNAPFTPATPIASFTSVRNSGFRPQVQQPKNYDDQNATTADAVAFQLSKLNQQWLETYPPWSTSD